MASRTDELRKRLEKDPGSRLFAQLAEELRKAGNLDEAIAVCRSGLEKHPSYPSAHMTLGRALFDRGDLSGARTELESVLKGAADNILASRLLGECLEGLGEVPEAIAQYERTLLLAPGDAHVVERLANLEAGGEPSKPVAAAPVAEEAQTATASPDRAAATREPGEAAGQPASASAEAPAQAETAAAPAGPAAPPAVPQSAAARAVTRPGMTGKAQAKNVVAAALAAKKARQETQSASAPEEKKAADIPTIARQPTAPTAPPQGVAPETAEPPTAGEPGQPTAPSAPPPQGVAPETAEPPTAGEPGQPTAPSAPPPQGVAPEMAGPPTAGEPGQPVADSERFPGMGDAESSLVGIHVGDLSDVDLPAEPAGEIVSATLAEVHIEQGHTEEGRAMYRKLVEREPGNQQARSRLAELESEARVERSPGDRKTIVRRQIAALERMLEGVRRG